MTDDQRDPIAAWLRAEAAGPMEAGDEAFAQAARAWTRAPLPPRLAARLRTQAAAAAGWRSDPWASWWIRGAVAAVVVLVGGALVLQPDGAIGWLALASLRAVAGGADRLLWVARTWLETAGLVCRPIVTTAGALGRVVLQPGPIAVLALHAIVAALGLAALRRLLTAREVRDA